VRVLVVAAHPDDEVLGMGGTLALHAIERSDTVRVLCVTDGSSTQYAGDTKRRQQKNREARDAAAILGVTDYVHLDLPDMRLDTVPHVEVNAAILEHVHDFQPQIVYSVHPDVNLDHRSVFDSVNVATRPTPDQTVRRLLTFGPASSFEWTAPGLNWFIPNWFVDIETTMDLKLNAFALYETERREYPHPRSARALKAQAEFFGSNAGCVFAEAFVLVRAVDRGSAGYPIPEER
jgi:LmbE family N-acetylglucosaminyl deacetylase